MADNKTALVPLTQQFREAVRKGASDFANAPKNYLPASQVMPTARGSNNRIIDVSAIGWWSALQPIAPNAPADQRPRQRAILPGENIIFTPGADKLLSFDTLRMLSFSWDIIRMIIETRKDQICAKEWEIRVKAVHGEKNSARKKRQETDKVIPELKKFFERPDGVNPWKRWLRMWWEDSLVLDAVALWYQRDLDGKIANVIPLDAATINRCMTDQGLTPPPPSVAYQQVLYGIPAFNLSTNDLLYSMRNPMTNHRYGFSRIEQIMVTIGTGIRQQEFLLKYYTDGNMPEALCFLPADLPVDKVEQIQLWFDSVLTGDLAKRRRMTFLPGYGTENNAKPNIVFPKEPLLKNPADEWLVQLACYCFSVSAQPFLKMMNRATAESANELSQAEGLKPDADYVAEVVNQIIFDMGFANDYEFAWRERREVDPLKAAQTDKQLVGQVMTSNEIREDRGLDPSDEPEADMLGMWTPNGFVPLKMEDAAARAKALFDAQPKPAPATSTSKTVEDELTEEVI